MSNANHQAARAAAIAAGQKTYMGKPCNASHDGLRYSKTNICCRCCAERNATRCTGNEPGRPKAARVAPRPQAHRIVQHRPRAVSIKRPVRAVIADYAHSIEAREHSAYLDSLIRNLTASIKVPHEENA